MVGKSQLRPLRLLVVARRFWPLSEDSCQRLLQWTSSLHQISVEPTVLTARWHQDWTDQFRIRNVPVFRILPSPHTNWNETHFQRNLVQWVQSRLEEFDAIYVDRADSLLQVLLSKQGRWPIPIIARFAPDEFLAEGAPNIRLQPSAKVEAIRRCRWIVTPLPSSHRLLIASGIHESQVHRIGFSSFARIQRSPERKKAASESLAKLSGDFVVPNNTPLMVHLGNTSWNELRNVLLAVCDLLDAGASVRMWIIDSGISNDTIYDFLKDRGWHREILIFDCFDDLEEILHVADLAWVTSPGESLQFTLPLIIAAELPVLVREMADLQNGIVPGIQESMYCSPTDLALKLHRWYANATVFRQNALQLKNTYQQSNPASRDLELWRRLLEQATGN
jgi:hypothetical protein